MGDTTAAGERPRIGIDLRPLNESRTFRLLWTAGVISGVGTRFTTIAMVWQVKEITDDDAGKLALVGLCYAVPLLVLSVFGGAIADKRDRRTIIVGTSLVGLCTAGVLAANSMIDQPHLWVIYAVAVANACQMAIAGPARMSLSRLLVRQELLGAAAALDQVSYNIAFVGGPLAAGLLIGVAGVEWTYVIDIVSYAVAIVLVLAAGALPRMDVRGRTLDNIVEGIRYIRSRSELVAAFLADVIAMVFGYPSVLMALVVAERYQDNPRALGALLAAVPAGMLCSALTSGWTARVHRHGMGVVFAISLWGLAIATFAFTGPFWLSFLVLMFAGVGDSISGVFRMQILQTGTPPEMMGRIMGVGMAVWAAGPQLGDFEAGALADLTSVDTSIFVGGVASVLGVWLLAFVWPAFRTYDAREHRARLAASPPASAGVVGPTAQEAVT
jgi:MFS family permease